jgi:hydrogenase nickel incorporation protein HypA/HybF
VAIVAACGIPWRGLGGVPVHELSMCEAIARTVVDRAAGRRVVTVRVRIGHLRQVVPDTMSFCWEMLTTSTVLEGAALQIEHVPATVACDACNAITELDVPVLICGGCGSRLVTLRSGDELTLESLETAREAMPREVAH